jgi:hypothetical protein
VLCATGELAVLSGPIRSFVGVSQSRFVCRREALIKWHQQVDLDCEGGFRLSTECKQIPLPFFAVLFSGCVLPTYYHWQ